ALILMDRGVARPAWAEHVGAVEAADCYVNSDAYGDRDEVICVFSYAGQEQHALVVAVDYNASGMVRDGWVTSQVDKLLDYCRTGLARAGEQAAPAAAIVPAAVIGPGAARRPTWRRDRRAMLAAEFLASDEAEDLSDLEAASRCADQIVDYGCDQDFGRPLRV